MKLRHIVCCCALAALGGSGCAQGGRFFNDMEAYVDNQGSQGADMVDYASAWRQEEVAKPRDLMNDFKNYQIRNDQDRQTCVEDIARYKANERTAWPTVTPPPQVTGASSGGEGAVVVKRTWPDQEGNK